MIFPSLSNVLTDHALWIVLGLSAIIIALFAYLINRIRTSNRYRNRLYNDALCGVRKSTYLEPNFTDILIDFDRNVSMYYINIDNFKNYNDLFGYHVANKILAAFAQRLKSIVHHDYIFRVHSDRFILLNALEEDRDNTFSDYMLSALKEPYTIDDQDITITVSIGRYDIEEDNAKFQEAILKSELALDEAKLIGKDQMVVYQSTFKDEHHNAFDMFHLLKDAIDSDNFYLAFQPIVTAKDQKVVGFESLIRIENKHRLVFASDLIYYAERFNMIDKVDRLVAKKTFEAYQYLKAKGVDFDFLSMNISASEINDPTFITYLKNLLKTYDIDAKDIFIEFTETLDPQGLEAESTFISSLRALGFKVAIDDFGSGYSSMLRLSKNTLDRIKIDKMFVNDIMNSPSNQSLVKAMVNLSEAFGLDVIVEGVESKAAFEFMRDLGIKYIQGYYFYRPMKLEAIAKTIKPDIVSTKTD